MPIEIDKKGDSVQVRYFYEAAPGGPMGSVQTKTATIAITELQKITAELENIDAFPYSLVINDELQIPLLNKKQQIELLQMLNS